MLFSVQVQVTSIRIGNRTASTLGARHSTHVTHVQRVQRRPEPSLSTSLSLHRTLDYCNDGQCRAVVDTGGGSGQETTSYFSHLIYLFSLFYGFPFASNQMLGQAPHCLQYLKTLQSSFSRTGFGAVRGPAIHPNPLPDNTPLQAFQLFCILECSLATLLWNTPFQHVCTTLLLKLCKGSFPQHSATRLQIQHFSLQHFSLWHSATTLPHSTRLQHSHPSLQNSTATFPARSIPFLRAFASTAPPPEIHCDSPRVLRIGRKVERTQLALSIVKRVKL